MLEALEMTGGPLATTKTVLVAGSNDALNPEVRAGLKNTVRAPSVGPFKMV